uniref:BTB domain-containing protein n=1 Tax=Strongyloides papillosus TaxID=174720 RepID=A0A0N5BGN5_STREA
MPSNESSSNPNNQLISKKNIEKAGIVWAIDKFSICKEKPGELRQSPIFSSNTDDKIKWSLLMYPNGNEDKNKDFISLYLKWEEIDNIDVRAMWIFYVKNFEGEKKYIKFTNTTKFNRNEMLCGNSKFFKRDLLLKSDSKFLVNDTLILGCEIFYFCGLESNANTQTNNNGNEPLNTLTNDFGRMLESAKSEVFDHILTGKQHEPTPNVIEIDKFSPKAVKEMIKYLYTGNLPEMDEMACEMLAIGDEYILNPLKSKAEESLIDSLTKDNICDYLVKSEAHSAEILQKWCLRFIYLNPEITVNSSEWEKVADVHPLLVGKLFMIFANIE